MFKEGASELKRNMFKEYWRRHNDTFCEPANGERLMVDDRNHSHPHSGSS